MALTAYYYPFLDFWKEMLFEDDDEAFAFWSENAQWVHSQMLMVQQANSIGLLGGASKKR